MKTFKTSTSTYKISSNKSARTFTIRTDTGNKYRTVKMDKEEFDSCENNTANDWRDFLRSDDYYKI